MNAITWKLTASLADCQLIRTFFNVTLVTQESLGNVTDYDKTPNDFDWVKRVLEARRVDVSGGGVAGVSYLYFRNWDKHGTDARFDIAEMNRSET